MTVLHGQAAHHPLLKPILAAALRRVRCPNRLNAHAMQVCCSARLSPGTIPGRAEHDLPPMLLTSQTLVTRPACAGKPSFLCTSCALPHCSSVTLARHITGASTWNLACDCCLPAAPPRLRSCAVQPKSLEHADDLFHKADLNQDGKLRLEELRNLLREASKEYSHLEEHSRFLDA